MAASDAPRSARAHASVIAGAAFVASGLWLSLRAASPLHPDTGRDLAFARDLATGTLDHGHGTWSGFLGLVQGTTWIDLLALMQLAGLGAAGIDRLVTLLLAGTVALATWSFLRLLPLDEPGAGVESGRGTRGRLGSGAPIPALVASLVYLALLPGCVELPILWQPTLLPVPILLAHLSLWRVARSGALLDALALAVLAVLALDVHVVAVLFIGLALVVVPLASRRPLIATAASGALGLASLQLFSPGVLDDNIGRLDESGLLWPALIAVVVAVGLAFAARRRFVALSWSQRSRVVVALELSLILALALASLVDITPGLNGRYLALFAPTIALGAGMLSQVRAAPRERKAALALACAALLLSWPWLRDGRDPVPPDKPSWLMRDLEPIAAHLRAEGLTWTEAALTLHGPDYDVLLSHLASELDAGTTEPEAPASGHLLVRLDGEQLEHVRPELGDALRAEFELDGGHAALLIDAPARTRRDGAQVCRAGGSECAAVSFAVTRRVYQAHPNGWVGEHTATEWLSAEGRGMPGELMWRLPVHAGPATFVQLSERLPLRCRWHIVASEGLELADPLPSLGVRLPAEAEGALLISRNLDEASHACASWSSMPPDLIETRASWERLQALLEVDDTLRPD